MEAEPRDGYTLTIPLLDDSSYKDDEKKQQKQTEGNTSFFKTCFNGLNALSGVGILSIPHALSSGGWLSLILLFAIAIIAFYTALLIKRCMDLDPNIKTYPDIGELAFGKRGRLVASIFMNLELYLVATGFLILEGDNLYTLFPIEGFEIIGSKIEGKQMFVIIVGLIIVPTVLLNDMSIHSYISASGVLASTILLGSILWTGVYDGIGFNEKGRLLNWSGLPTAVSLYAFCYCTHPVFPTLYTSMRKKSEFSKVLLLCFLFCTTVYVSMAIFGYLMFGSKVESQITLNLPTEKISSKVAIYTTLVNPIAKYALMLKPVVDAIESKWLLYQNRRPTSLLIRITLVVSTVVVALTVPFFGSLMALVGAFLSLTASILIPCLCYLKVTGTYERLGFEQVAIVGILLGATLVAIVGTYASVEEIIGQF